MDLIAKCVEAVRRFDKAALSLEPHVLLPKEARAILQHSRLVIADIGAAGEPDPRWEKLKPAARFITFEPRVEKVLSDASTTNYPFCLGSKSGQQILYLTRFADSSSLYPLNMERMGDFAVRDCFEVVGSMRVEVRSLDELLANAPTLRPHFLKLDVEGAELDVLRGAETALIQSVRGLRGEVSFLERHEGAPLFGDVDAFLRERGFEMFALSREHMIRRNLWHAPLSQPQLVWGDAVYFLTRRSFLQRLARLSDEDRIAAIIKFVAILLAHRVHDFTIEVIDAARTANLISTHLAAQLEEAAQQSARRSIACFFKAAAGSLFALLIYLLSLPVAPARRMATFYLKRRVGYLFHYFWRLTARGGERNASVSDSLL